MSKRKRKKRIGQGKRKPRPTTPLKLARVVTAMRAENISLTHAAHEEGISRATVLRHAGKALRKTAKGTYKARKSDRLLRVLILPTPAGLAEIATADSRAATMVAEYWNAVNHYLETGDDAELSQFRGVTVTDAQGNAVPLLTDTDELDRLGAAGILSFQSLYARAS